jgi:hypothetical protein
MFFLAVITGRISLTSPVAVKSENGRVKFKRELKTGAQVEAQPPGLFTFFIKNSGIICIFIAFLDLSQGT